VLVCGPRTPEQLTERIRVMRAEGYNAVLTERQRYLFAEPGTHNPPKGSLDLFAGEHGWGANKSRAFFAEHLHGAEGAGR
jgi:hypothetical protein